MSELDIPFTNIVRGLPAAVPFVGPETLERERGQVFRARLGANESAFGVSPHAARAMVDAVEHVSWYADPENFELRATLAERHGVDMDEICVGAGIDGLLGLTVRMTVKPGTPVVTSLGAYPTFNYHVAGFGGVLKTVPYLNDHEDPEALIASVTENQAPLVYLANPDNPMGTWHNAAEIQRFIDRVPQGTIAVLDEAYIEFAPQQTSPPIDTTDSRVMRMRTFSKAHGMAGARIGYAIANRELITGLNKIRNHFEVNRVAQAGALASLDDAAFTANVVTAVSEGRQAIARLAQGLGLASLPSATNFVAVDMGSPARAKAMLQALLGRDVFVRMPGVAPLDRCIRVSVGRQQERALFAQSFTELLGEID